MALKKMKESHIKDMHRAISFVHHKQDRIYAQVMEENENLGIEKSKFSN